MVSFDLGAQWYQPPVFPFMEKLYPGRLKVILGDSAKTFPAFERIMQASGSGRRRCWAPPPPILYEVEPARSRLDPPLLLAEQKQRAGCDIVFVDGSKEFEQRRARGGTGPAVPEIRLRTSPPQVP